MTALGWLQDRTDSRVIDALKRTCGICKAAPNNDCVSPFGGDLGRIVHLERTEQHLDRKRKKS